MAPKSASQKKKQTATKLKPASDKKTQPSALKSPVKTKIRTDEQQAGETKIMMAADYKVLESGREGSIEDGDQPENISSSCKIQDEIYHMVTFKQKVTESVAAASRKAAKEQIKPRLYKSKTLRKIATDFLIDFYESQIEWLDIPPSKKNTF